MAPNPTNAMVPIILEEVILDIPKDSVLSGNIVIGL
jgi:hypothetical protein